MLHKLGLARTGQLSTGPALLSHIMPSACADLDATIQASYGGEGQVWTNLVAAPADGAPAASYDFFLGLTQAVNTDDPAFHGVAGQTDAYWRLDGHGGFKQRAETGFISRLHKENGQDFTLITAFRYQSGSGEQRIFSTQLTAGLGPGVTLAVNSAKRLMFRQRGEGGVSQAILFDVVFTEGDYVCILSHNREENMTRFWVNSRDSVALAQGFGDSIGNAETVALGGRATLNADFMADGTRFYHFGLLNTAIGDAGAAQILDLLNARHNRIYA